PILFVLEPGNRGLRTRGLPGRFAGSRVRRVRAIVGFDRRADQPDRKDGGNDEQRQKGQRGDPGQHDGTARLLLLLLKRGLGRVDEVLLIGGGSLSWPLFPSSQEFEFGCAPQASLTVTPVIRCRCKAPAKAFVLAPVAQPS